jgi:hypothetical protein
VRVKLYVFGPRMADVFRCDPELGKCVAMVLRGLPVLVGRVRTVEV